ncbi:DUF6262 family protein [Streptomyces sp. NPDC054933]
MSPTMRDGRQANSERRRQRVATAIKNAAKNGTPINVLAIARQAGVDRTFLYRHRDLLELVHAAELEPAGPGRRLAGESGLAPSGPRQRPGSQHPPGHRVQQLEKRLSQALGAQAWQESGLGAPTDIDEIQRKITRLEQQNVELTAQLEETRSDLDAARAAYRDLTRARNQRG